MSRTTWPSLCSSLAILLALLALVSSQAHDPPALEQQLPLAPQPHHVPPVIEDTFSAHAPPAVQDTIAVSHVVHDTLRTLRAQQPSPSRFARLGASKGVMATIIYYIKELFVLLFMNPPSRHNLITGPSVRPPAKLSRVLKAAVATLEREAFENDNPDATFVLAELNFYGNFSHPRNYTRAFEHYQHLASHHANHTAQYMLGFMYATGIGGAVDQDQAKALLYHTFAANAGNTRSQMTVAYRHAAAIGTPRNCERAVSYYKIVADKALAYYKSGPPGGHVLTQNAYRLADTYGGVYGQGAAIASPRFQARTRAAGADSDLEDQLEYLDFQSRKGDLRATYSMAKMHYDGTSGLKRDLRLAKDLFMQVARMYWPAQGPPITDASTTVQTYATRAAGYLGRMFLRGEGIEQSYAKAIIWFKRGIDMGDSLSQYSLGFMYLEGLGLPKDPLRAAEYFKPAADNNLAVAQTALGILFLDQGEFDTARLYFELAIDAGHIEAYYYLAHMAERGIGSDKVCGVAAMYYTNVAQLGEVIHSSFIEANEAYASGDMETALVNYMMAAEQGYESAQANSAALMDQMRPRYAFDSLVPFAKRRLASASDAALALVYWTRSAEQHNLDSLIKMGDYYLDGLGVAQPSAENAAACYQAGAETMRSAQGMWNLGWMHENGIGMQQDFHLAKRFYDQALETDPATYLPVKLALIKLRLRSWWNGISGGGVNSIKDEPDTRPRRSFSEWLAAFLEADAEYHAMQQLAVAEADDWDPYEVGGGVNNPLLDQGHHHVGGGGGGGAGAQQGAGAAAGREEHLGLPDLALEDGIVETVVVASLAVLLACLLFWRQVERQRRRRERDEQRARQNALARAEIEQQRSAGQRDQADEAEFFQGPPAQTTNTVAVGETLATGIEGAEHAQQQEQQGLFPPVGDPNFANWVSGGIGH